MTCVPLWWGRRLAALQVDLERVEPRLVALLLEEAWRRRANNRGRKPPV